MSHEGVIKKVGILFSQLAPGDHFYVNGPTGMVFWRVEEDGSLKELARQHPVIHLERVPWNPSTTLEDVKPALGVRMFNILTREGFRTIGDVIETWEANGRVWFAKLRSVRDEDMDLLTKQMQTWRARQ